MTAYAFWNNKGGVGKTFLCFVAASEYAHMYPNTDVYVIDLCPQGNVSETLLGGYESSPKALKKIIQKNPRSTIAGYLEARLNSPFKMIGNVSDYITQPSDYNPDIPDNISLICGDYLLEILSEAIRQTSQLAIPTDAWSQVVSWVKDMVMALRERSSNRDSVFFVDCNPSFAIYTQLALAASDKIIVPFTGDDSSRRAIENVVALLYGVGDPHIAAYARISFSKRALEEGLEIPKLHSFVSNRVTLYEGKASKAFRAVSKTIKSTVNNIHEKHRTVFSNPGVSPSKSFFEVPDYHGASIVSALTGTPLHRLKAGPRTIEGERVQINKDPLERYRTALQKFVNTL